MKKFWLHSLLKVYAVIMVAIVGCLGLICFILIGIVVIRKLSRLRNKQWIIDEADYKLPSESTGSKSGWKSTNWRGL